MNLLHGVFEFFQTTVLSSARPHHGRDMSAGVLMAIPMVSVGGEYSYKEGTIPAMVCK